MHILSGEELRMNKFLMIMLIILISITALAQTTYTITKSNFTLLGVNGSPYSGCNNTLKNSTVEILETVPFNNDPNPNQRILMYKVKVLTGACNGHIAYLYKGSFEE